MVDIRTTCKIPSLETKVRRSIGNLKDFDRRVWLRSLSSYHAECYSFEAKE